VIWHRRSPFALAPLAALVAAGLLLAGRAAAPPAVPPGPALPDFSKIPGARVAHFKVIVEGTATAAKDEDWAAETPCTVSINARIEETTTYRRGKGVVMEFVQLTKGGPVIVQRKGRSYDASLALTTTTTRTSSGTAIRTDPPNGPGVCAPLTEDLSQGPDCGKPQVDTAKAGLVFTNGLLSIRPRALGALVEIDCPTSQVRGGIPSLYYAWPTPPPLRPFRVSAATIFAKTPKVIVETRTTGVLKKGPQTAVIGSLHGTVSEFGRNTLTLRMIRVP